MSEIRAMQAAAPLHPRVDEVSACKERRSLVASWKARIGFRIASNSIGTSAVHAVARQSEYVAEKREFSTTLHSRPEKPSARILQTG